MNVVRWCSTQNIIRDKVVVFIIFVSSECEKDLTTGVPVSRVSRATRTFIFFNNCFMTMIQHRPGTAEGDKVLAIVIQVNE